jgi:hypothetical protein
MFRRATEEGRLHLIASWRFLCADHDFVQRGIAGKDERGSESGNPPEVKILQCQEGNGEVFSPLSLDQGWIDVDDKMAAEPYVLSGYETLAQRDYLEQSMMLRESQTKCNQVTDPVFLGAESPKPAQEGMENHYGIYTGVMEAMVRDANFDSSYHTDDHMVL